MISLDDFLLASQVIFTPAYTKVHLACSNGRENPLDEFFAGRFKEWQEHQNRRIFSCKHILSLIDVGASDWLFAGVYNVDSVAAHPKFPNSFLYSTTLLPGQEEVVGRVIVWHKRRGRQSYIWLKNIQDIKLQLVEVRRKKMTVGEFPGYNAIAIDHRTLRIITDQQIASWYAALANIKGVYLITDTFTGKHYVGKASGSVGIWQRWCAYADNGHGDNVKLKALLARKGTDYMKHFQYSILEIADTHASDNDILDRESYWMQILKTRDFGLN